MLFPIKLLHLKFLLLPWALHTVWYILKHYTLEGDFIMQVYYFSYHG